MAKIYWRSIKRGRKFESIPDNMKSLVKDLAMAEVANGTITVEQYKEFIGEDYPVAE